MRNQNTSDIKTAKGKKMFLLLALVFVLPFTIAFTMHLLDIRPGGKSVGYLITPVIELETPAFDSVEGDSFAAEQWSQVWSIVMVDAAGCLETCEKNVDKLNRVHRTFYKDKDRLQRILILSNAVDTVRIAQLQEKFPKLIVLVSKSPAQQQFVEQFNQLAPKASVYLVDPLNNLMMYYPQDFALKGLRKDIKKLLKGSWNG